MSKQAISFFKILCRRDFARLLRLPHVFMRKYGSILPRKLKLRTESGQTWGVKVEPTKEEEDLFCFSRGWDVFAKDAGLKFGEFLVFVLDNDGFTLDVSIYETTGCIKEFPLTQHSSDDDGGVPLREMTDPLYYEILLKPHNRYRVTLKRRFVRAGGLKGKKTVVLAGKRHSVCVSLDNTHKDADRIDLARGWSEFKRVNGLVYGKTYSFEFKPRTNLIQVNEVDTRY